MSGRIEVITRPDSGDKWSKNTITSVHSAGVDIGADPTPVTPTTGGSTAGIAGNSSNHGAVGTAGNTEGE